jgi:hypothetical protein
MKTFVVGDIHGCLDELQALLQRLSLLDDQLTWAGADARLWFLGDYTDRGPDGVGVIDLVMRLEREAPATGGRVTALLGNHDVILCNAFRFSQAVVPDFTLGGKPLSFEELWLQHAGGRPEDAARIQPHHLTWLRTRPALARFGTTLLMHADSSFYLDYGSCLTEVNATIRRLLHGSDLEQRNRFEEKFARRNEFLPGHPDDVEATHRLGRVLRTFKARSLVHGHTAVFSVLHCPAADVVEPLGYQSGRCTNVDHGLVAGGPGFAFSMN